MTFILRGRRNICCSWRLPFVAPRIVNDVSYVMRINHKYFVVQGSTGVVQSSICSTL